jgi:hypothetical protein
MKFSNSQIFTGLTDRITEKVSSMQIKLTKFKNINKRNLEQKIESLRERYIENENEICKLEKQVRAINDFEIRHLMHEKKIFENLNFERPSKSFLEIAKAIQSNDKILNICKDAGTAFDNEAERNDYITNFYSNLYMKDEGIGGSIEEFLGEDICNHQLVKDSKLLNNEKEELEADLTLDELTKALGQSNMRSAPGIDGFSMWRLKSRNKMSSLF